MRKAAVTEKVTDEPLAVKPAKTPKVKKSAAPIHPVKEVITTDSSLIISEENVALVEQQLDLVLGEVHVDENPAKVGLVVEQPCRPFVLRQRTQHLVERPFGFNVGLAVFDQAGDPFGIEP